MSNETMIGEVARISAETAVVTAMKYIEDERKKAEKQRKDFRLRNTKLLLKNYRSFMMHGDDIHEELKEIEVPNDMFEEMHSNEFVVEAIKRSKERTLAMIKFMDQMLQVYRILCEESGKDEDLRRYQTIHKMYIAEEKISVENIAECHKTNVRTVYRDVNEAVKTLSVLVFGVDGIKLIK
ncbi:hypothetical protein [Alkalicoccobacillus plakortidis]|uniref:HTH domain-containing protein n=1 Tax=Alkalicoccobacillus plakortidis TaxID=444060 RepID=A0ABT0XI92_9BACI|nr:hypothetical protein [Alkalicoccobacillus plakortidis]MCM2675592.1 hypothetical protein [Alkalicoccobacillus plakortidis]